MLSVVRVTFLYAFLCVATFLMVRSVLGYATFDTDVQFLAFKQEYLPIAAWRFAFYVHVFSAVLALFAGFTQFTLTRGPVHRLLGKIYVANILLVNFPAALVMGIYANGGPLGKTAFLLLDLLWAWFTLAAWRAAVARNFPAHRAHMIRSYALTLSAITLRTWRIFLEGHPHVYVLEAWLGFVPNLLLAEAYLAMKRNQARVE